MHFPLSLTLLPTLLSLTHATNIPITVGADAKLAFNPQAVTANIGDTLTFSYFPKNHSVVQSSFINPCHPLANGFFSGFQPLAAGPGPVEFVVTVNDTKPIWIYCAQTAKSHCQSGMAMVVNQPFVPPSNVKHHSNIQPRPPPSPNTLDAYKLAAAKTGNSTSPPAIAGGVFVPLMKNTTSTTAAGTATTFSTATVYTSTSASGSGSYSGFSEGASYTRSSSPIAVTSTISAGATVTETVFETKTVVATQTVAGSSCY